MDTRKEIEFAGILPLRPIDTTVLSQESTTIHHLADIICRQGVLLLTCFALIGAGAWAYLRFTPDQYSADIRFLIKSDPSVPQLSPTAVVYPQGVDDAQIATEVEILSSWELLADVSRAAGLIQQKAGESDAAATAKAVDRLRRRMTTTPGVRSDTITVSYRGRTPQEPLKVLQALNGKYLDRHLDLRRMPGGEEFFREQASHYMHELGDAQAEMARFELRTKVVALPEQKDLNLRKLADLQGSLKDTEAARNEALNRSTELRRQLAATATRVTTQSRDVPNQYAMERLNTMLAELKNHETEMLTKYRPDDRMVLEVRQQIAQTESALKAAGENHVVEQATDVNPLRQQLESDLAEAMGKIAGLDARRATLARQMGEYSAGLDKLSSATAARTGLERQVNEAESLYLLYSRKYEESRASSAMNDDRIANIGVLEAPRLPTGPDPKTTINFYLAVALAVAAVLGLILLRGIRRRGVYTPWELELVTNAPVLGTIPLTTRSMAALEAGNL